MSVSLSAERDRIQRQVEELEQSLYVNDAELDLLSSETDDGSDDGSDEEEDKDESAGLKERREKIQREIQNLEDVLGHPDVDDSSSDESELGLSLSVDSCLQMNLVYQQVLQETLDQLELLLTHNVTQQKELMSQLSGPIREHPREQTAPSSYQQPITMYLGRFLKPYFKDKLTGLGPPANQETRDRSSRMTGVLDNNQLKVKRWESWQKTLLFHSVSTDQLKRLVQPKLSRVEYLSHKLSSAVETDRQPLREQIDSLEREISLLRGKKEDELIGERHDEHDWEKISNIDFEGTRDAADIRCFWQNFLHPSINKSQWSREEVQQLKEASRRRQEEHWEEIAKELETGRTAFMCLQTFQRFLSESLRRSSWTPAEDDVLRLLVEKMRIGNFIPYTQMSYFMEGRQPSQLVYRWNQVLDPAIKKGMWTEEEDQLLRQAVARHGEKNWWKIRLEVPGRTYNGCRDRYLDCLKAGTKRGPFDQQEIDLLLKLVKKHGVGHWAKIAAEIPQRIDSQCLRTWRALGNDPEVRELAKAKRRARRQAARGGAQEAAEEEKKKGGAARKNVRRRPVKEEEISEEEEEMVVQYMDSDDDKEKLNVVLQMVEVEEQVVPQTVEEGLQVEVKEEVEEEYSIPPMQDWIPAIKGLGLRFRPAAFPQDSTTCRTPPVRSTVLMKSGVSVVVGPPPRELPSAARRRSALMMVTAEDLRVHLNRLAYPSISKERHGRSTRPRPRPRLHVCYELMAAVTPWIGHLVIQTTAVAVVADGIRERAETKPLPSGAVFRMLLRSLLVDVEGCKQMIVKRREAGVAEHRLLLRRRTRKQVDVQQRLILKQLLEVQEVQEVQLPRRPQPLLLLQCTSSTLPQLLLPGPQWAPQVAMSHPAPHAAPHPAPPPAPHPAPHPAPPAAPPPAPRSPLLATASRLQEVSSMLTNELPAPSSAQQPPRKSLQVEAQEEVQDVSGSPHEAEVVRNHLTPLPPPLHLHPAPPQHLHPAPPLHLHPAPPQHLHSAPETPPSPSTSRLSVLLDHQYVCMNSAPERRCRQLKRQREEAQREEEEVRWEEEEVQREEEEVQREEEEAQQSTQEGSEGEAGPGSVQGGKRRRKPSQKAQALLETIRTQVEAKKRRGLHSQQMGGNTSRVQPPRSGTPQVGGPRSRTPQVGGPRSGTPQVGGPRSGTPRVGGPQSGTPQVGGPRSGTPRVGGPQSGTPRVGGPRSWTPRFGGPPLSGLHLNPSQSMWVVTPAGLVQLTPSVPQNLPVVLKPGPSGPLPPRDVACPVAPPPLPLPVPVKPLDISQPIPTGSSPLLVFPSRQSSRLFPPYRAAVPADPASPRPLRTEDLCFDGSLMFLEPAEAVRDWLNGQGGVSVAGTGSALPYLPPFLSSLSVLSALLRARKSLRRASRQLLVPDCGPQNHQNLQSEPQNLQSDPQNLQSGPQNLQTGPTTLQSDPQNLQSEPQNLQTGQGPWSAADPPNLTTPVLPDSTWDLGPDQPGPCDGSEEQKQEEEEEEEQEEEEEEQEEQVAAVRHLVSERFASNPAYQLLKARFLSCFTVPALLATVQPITEEEEEEEEEEELNITEIKGGSQSDEGPVLLCDITGAPANQFSGMDGSTPDRTGSKQTNRKRKSTKT